MKPAIIHRFLAPAGISIFFLSCTLQSQIEVIRPADITGIEKIKTVAVVNRTEVPKESKTGNVIEGILTGETIGADKQGAENCISGIRDNLSNSLNYSEIKVSPRKMQGVNQQRNSQPLEWSRVDSICNEHQADALVVLEYFDSNSGLSTVVDPAMPMPMPRATRTNNSTITTFWRYYIPGTRQILDEMVMKTPTNCNLPKSPYLIDNQINKHNMVTATGYYAGADYGFRISEQWVVENREYFKGGNTEMRYASRLSRLNDWDKAAGIWEEQLQSHKRKVRSRAYHNLAVYFERKGDLLKAIEYSRLALEIRVTDVSLRLNQRLNLRLAEQDRIISLPRKDRIGSVE